MQALIDRHGEDLQHRFSSAAVAVCGLGGLGSNIAIMLARAGIGRLILVDFDTVDLTNLHRQQYLPAQIGMKKTEALKATLRAINPYLEIETHAMRITAENARSLLEDVHIVCEAFDDAEEKAMLAETILTQMPDKYLIASSGMAGMASANAIKTRRITDRFYLCGDEKSDAADTIGLVSSRVTVCAAHQAHMVLRILAGQTKV